MANKKRVIHAGGVFPNPLLNREGAAASYCMPGDIGIFSDSDARFVESLDGTEKAILYVANYDYLRCNTVDDPFKEGDWIVGIHPLPGMFLNVRANAGKYKKGQPLTIEKGSVRELRGTEGEVIFAYVEEDVEVTVSQEDLIRVVFK